MHYEKWSNTTMRGILTCAGQCFAVVAVAIGLSSSGCMGSATVNPVAELASLTVTPGTLQPAFTGGNTDYNVNLTSDVTSVRITAQPAVAGDKVTINDQATTSSTIILGPEGSTTSVSIVVSESSNNSRTYIVFLKRASLAGNNSLLSLAVSPGTLAPAFNANTQNYSVDVANNVDSVTVTPTLQDSTATMTVNGEATNSGEESQPIQLGGTGSITPIDIVVTAQDRNQKTYRVTFNRGKSGNNFLQNLAILPGPLNPSFSAGIEGYTVNLSAILPGNPTTMTVTPTLQDATATMKVNGQDTNSGQARTTSLPAPGESTFITIVVTAQNGTPKTYSVNVIRAALNGNNFLSALTISPGTLAPVFNAGTTGYTVNLSAILPGNPTTMTVTPTLQDATATMKVNGQDTNSGQARTTSLPALGESTFITIVVTAQNGTPKTYSVNVIRAALNGNNFLSALTISPGTLAPVFNAGTTGYTVNLSAILPGNPTTMTVTPTLQDATATMKVNGQDTNSGQARTTPLPAPGESTFITIVVTAQNGTLKTYSINVIRAALNGNNFLSALIVTPGTLNPSFSAGTEDYTANLPSILPGTVTNMTVTPTLQDLTANMTVNGQPATSGQPQLTPLPAPGSTTLITIVVTAQNGSPKTYSINVIRAALSGNNNLSAMTVTSGTLVPPFDSGIQDYTVDVATDVTDVTVTATKADSNAVMSGAVTAGTGQATGQAIIPLDGPGTSKDISITVTAPNGSSKIYTITVNRAAPSSNNNLSALTATPGALTPVFDSNTTAYTVDVTSDVTSVTVTATLADTSAGMTINGQGTSSGQASPINLGAEGSSTNVTIVVTAPNGNSKIYTITVNRASAAPPSP